MNPLISWLIVSALLLCGLGIGLYFLFSYSEESNNTTPPPPQINPAPQQPIYTELPEAALPAETVNYNLHGCYADTQARLLPIHNPADMIKNAEECAAFAKEKKAKFFGLQFANGRKDGRAECWVGNLPGDSIDNYQGRELPDSNCGTYNESTVGLYGYTQAVYGVV